MSSLRSQETLQKEYDLQAQYTARINIALQGDNEEGYREKLEDAAVFANVLRKYVPENTLVILHERPEIILRGEGEDFTIALFINGNCWSFKVNDSTHYTLGSGETFAPSKMLKQLWDVVIGNLPDEFVVRGTVDPKDPPAETEARTKLQQSLGFGLPQANNEVYGVVRNKTLHPLTLTELTELTGIQPEELDQRFNLRKITWKGV